MGLERSFLRLIIRAQAHASAGAVLQRGAALSIREYYASSALTSPSDGFSRTELRESVVGKKSPIWQEWSRGYADSSVEKDDTSQGNAEYLEFGTHQTTSAKRFVVGTTAVDVDEAQEDQKHEEIKEKAKEILQQVGEKIDETVEEAQVRQLQEKLAATEGIGHVVHELYNKPEEHTGDSEPGEGIKA